MVRDRRVIFVQYGTGHVGEDWAEVFEVHPHESDTHIELNCQDIAFDWAASYGRETSEDQEDCWWDWEDYSPEEHDQYRGSGGSFKEDLDD